MAGLKEAEFQVRVRAFRVGRGTYHRITVPAASVAAMRLRDGDLVEVSITRIRGAARRK